jgi:hypothetical protein
MAIGVANVQSRIHELNEMCNYFMVASFLLDK